jgi:hypothetical protein
MLPEINGIFVVTTAIAVFLTVVIGAPQFAGVISMNQARIGLFVGWVAAIVLACVSVKNAPTQQIVIAGLTTAIIVGLLLIIEERWITKKVREREAAEGNLPGAKISTPWLRPYLKCFLLAWREFRLSWSQGWGFARFLVMGALAATGLFFGLHYVLNIPSASTWVAAALFLLVASFLCIIELLRRAYDKTLWLQEIANKDRQNIGAAVAITKCELRLDLECSHPYAEFTFGFFNGSLVPISVEMKLDGHISFSDGLNVCELKDKPKELKSKSFKNTREEHARLVSGEFTIRQKLSPDDVAFISTVRSYRDGYFIFDKLVIAVRGYGENIQAARLPMERVRPRLKGAYRDDATALESKRQAHLSKIDNLNIIRGSGLQLWALLRLNDEPLEKAVLDAWEDHVRDRLTESYGDEDAKKIYEGLSHGDPIPDSAPFQRGWVEGFFAQLQYLISEEKKKV